MDKRDRGENKRDSAGKPNLNIAHRFQAQLVLSVESASRNLLCRKINNMLTNPPQRVLSEYPEARMGKIEDIQYFVTDSGFGAMVLVNWLACKERKPQ